MSNSGLFLSHEAGQTCGEQPVHPHDEEVGEDVGEGEVEGDVVRARAGRQRCERVSVAVSKHLQIPVRSFTGWNYNNKTHHLPPEVGQVGPHHLHGVVQLCRARELAGGVQFVSVGELPGGDGRVRPGGGGGALSVPAHTSPRCS